MLSLSMEDDVFIAFCKIYRKIIYFEYMYQRYIGILIYYTFTLCVWCHVLYLSFGVWCHIFLVYSIIKCVRKYSVCGSVCLLYPQVCETIYCLFTVFPGHILFVYSISLPYIVCLRYFQAIYCLFTVFSGHVLFVYGFFRLYIVCLQYFQAIYCLFTVFSAHILFVYLQVCEAKPLTIQADVMEDELKSCFSTDYGVEGMPLLLHQVGLFMDNQIWIFYIHFYLPPADRPGREDYKMPEVRPSVRSSRFIKGFITPLFININSPNLHKRFMSTKARLS